MKRATDLPELLSPAGDMDSLSAAILGGADAIYVGGLRFGARAFAKNFSVEELKAAVTLCHLNGVRLYVTLNTLVFDKEIKFAGEEFFQILVDKVIKGIFCHIGTQMFLQQILFFLWISRDIYQQTGTSS